MAAYMVAIFGNHKYDKIDNTPQVMTIRQRILFELERLRRKNLQQLHPLQQLFWEDVHRLCHIDV